MCHANREDAVTKADQDALDVEALIDLLYLVADAMSICERDCGEGPHSVAELPAILSNVRTIGNALLARASDRETRARGASEGDGEEKATHLICGHA
jgi:hypothetical protein